MFKAGDWVAFKKNPQVIFEVANYSEIHGYDIWNQNSYYSAIDEHLLILIGSDEQGDLQQF